MSKKIIEEFTEWEGKYVPLLRIKVLLNQNLDRSQMKILINILQFFDKDKNGTVFFNQIKIVLLLLYQYDD